MVLGNKGALLAVALVAVGSSIENAAGQQMVGYTSHPGKFWYESQCPPTTDQDISVEDCRKACENDVDCDAFHYHNDGAGCEFRRCPPPIHAPTKTNIEWTAYNILNGGVYPGKYWSTTECPRIDGSESLKICKAMCSKSAKCTAFNYDEKQGSCNTRKCKWPIPEPRGRDVDWIGYAADRVGKDLCSSLSPPGIWIAAGTTVHTSAGSLPVSCESCGSNPTPIKSAEGQCCQPVLTDRCSTPFQAGFSVVVGPPSCSQCGAVDGPGSSIPGSKCCKTG